MYQVLVAEDEFWIRNQVIELIERMEGFKVVGEAREGEEAWKLLNELWPHILITDIMMPITDGLELLQRVHDYRMSVAPIVISGCDNFSYAQQAMRLGVSEYVLKPISADKLRLALERSVEFMQRSHLHREQFLAVHEFIHKLDSLDQQGAWRELSELVKSVLHLKKAAPGEKLGLLRILSNKLREQSGGAEEPREQESTREWTAASIEDKEELLAYYYRLLENWFRAVEKSPHAQSSAAMEKAAEYVRQNYMREITLSQIAERADLSVSRFCVLFKKHSGDSFVNYLNRHRIEKAKQLLLETDLKIYEVADMVGFSTLPYFNRLFKAVTGLSPNEYKRSLGL